MSKIFDALKKSEARAAGPAPAPVPEPPDARESWAAPAARPDPPRPPDPIHPRLEPIQPRSAEIILDPSGLELPLEFVRELGTLRGTIDQLLPGRPVRTLLFAGAIAGEGSSTVAAAFARLLAEDERLQVCLVDGDLRSVRRRLPTVDDHHGFAGVLDGHLSIEQALVGTSLPNLAVVPGGATADSPLRLCTTNNLHAPLDWLRHHYHYVVIDGPPVLDSPEMVSLATQVDGIVLVVRAARTKREVVQRAIETIDKFQGRVLGAILNRQQYVIPDFIYRRL
jgi:capsular exopolysaccharide synthesis family protein